MCDTCRKYDETGESLECEMYRILLRDEEHEIYEIKNFA